MAPTKINKQKSNSLSFLAPEYYIHIVYSLLSYVLVKAWIYRFTKFSIITVVVQVVFLQKLDYIRLILLKFIYPEKAKKFDKISHLIWCLQWKWKLCWLPFYVSKKIQFHATFHWLSISNWNRAVFEMSRWLKNNYFMLSYIQKMFIKTFIGHASNLSWVTNGWWHQNQ